MHHQISLIKQKEQVFSATLDVLNGPPSDALAQFGLRLRPRRDRVDHATPRDSLTADEWSECASDGFHFGQLRHGCLTGGGQWWPVTDATGVPGAFPR